MSDSKTTDYEARLDALEREARLRHQRQADGAKYMRDLANEIRSPDTRMVSTDGAIARLAEGIAIILETML